MTPMLELIKELNGTRALIPPVTNRFVSRKEVCKILKVGTDAVSTLIKRGQLTQIYVADSSAAKFRLSEVMKIVEGKA